MSSHSVQPLRIAKSATSTPTSASNGTPRPLSELTPTERRRNSPSSNQGSPTKRSALSNDSSPFQSSPLDLATSPRLFWQNRNSENLHGSNGSASPTRRISIERLQKASRVKNSNILALEHKHDYDPIWPPQIERPLARVQMNAFALRSPISDKRLNDPFRTTPQKLAPSAMTPPKPSPSAIITGVPTKSPTRSRDQVSPTKSSLSATKFRGNFDQETGVWSPDASALDFRDLSSNRLLHRHTKSVTFDAAPPQVNEYEMTTPDLSSIGTNSREGSYDSMDEEDDEDDDVLYDPNNVDGGDDDSFDASLEDTDKTPVVGPDEWAAESPVSPVGREFEQFSGSPMAESSASVAALGRPSPNHQRSDSSSSVADHRPLPPLPPFSHARSQSLSPASPTPGPSHSSERVANAHRSLPIPPGPANKSDMVEEFIISGKMSLEERLKLVMLSDDTSSAREQQRERRLRRLSGRDRSSMGSRSTISRDITPNTSAIFTNGGAEENHEGESQEQGDGKHDGEHDGELEEEENIGDISGLAEYKTPPRITREAIMRHMNGNKTPDDNMEFTFSSPLASPERFSSLDPDVPIPSTEGSVSEEDGNEDEDLEEYDDDDDNGSVIITRPVQDDETDDDDTALDLTRDSDIEDDVDEEDLDDSLSQQAQPVKAAQSFLEDRELSFCEGDSLIPLTRPLAIANEAQGSRDGTPDDTQSDLEPRAIQQQQQDEQHQHAEHDELQSGHQLDAQSEDDSLDSVQEMQMDARKNESAPKDGLAVAKMKPKGFLRLKTEKLLPKPAYDGSGWGEPDDEYEDEEPGSPESVIHHPISDDEEFDEDDSYYDEMDEEEDPSSDDTARYSPAIPEEIATIKASGSKLKTRVSNTPSDIATMREARRHVSGEISHVPRISEQRRDLGSGESELMLDMSHEEYLTRHPSFKNRSLTLDLETGLSLDQDFERVIESQKRGYLMRQNTKLVSASDKDGEEAWRTTKAASTTPIKTIRPQSWTVEPWNGQTRKSLRKGHGSSGPVPPVAGKESNSSSLNRVIEEDASGDVASMETGERGRLFIKVMGVKDLDLPIPKNERSWFSLTLDNGVHCVTTAWLELARNAPIGQEFELVVPNDLEFQLTLNVKLEKPTYAAVQTSQMKMTRPKTSTFSRVFASPKKRRELEQRQRAEEERFAQQQMEALARERKNAGSAYELLSPFAAEDGSFARAYVCLKEHETCCFGRPYTVDVACFNEWATEEESFASSVKSKRGNGTIVRRAPYKIGKLELQLLFVPRPRNVTDDDMPKSMNSCIRELKAAEERLARNWEGLLSQNGGDCPYWRRRYFKLVGTKLTAYHEATRQPRATINLSNARRLIDDRRQLTEKDTTGKGGKRRKSAFAEEEEAFMFVEEGFRIRFNNGELIDFYADTAEDKEGWMKALSDVIGRGDSPVDEDVGGPRSRAKWCELVLKREEQLRRRSESRRIHSRTKSMYL